MSASEFYLNAGYTPTAKSTLIHGVSTISVWTPETGKRVALTGMSVSTNNAGTIAFYFDNGNEKFAEFLLAASSTVVPIIEAIESTVVSGRIFAKVSVSGTDGWRVNLTGFELG